MATNERSQVIMQKGPVTQATPVDPPVAAVAKAAQRPRVLCAVKPEGAHTLPKKHVSRAAAKSAQPLPEQLPLAGKWGWVNFWAAWCGPCKEEIPRLLGFETRLMAAGASFRLIFVSLDDDERQLQDFLEAQPGSGLRASYWLREGNEREDWLKAAGRNPDAPLPFHLLVDPKGKVVCAVEGAVEEGDYAQIAAIVSARSATVAH